MRTPLVERLAPGAPELERFDATVERMDIRLSTRADYAPSTDKAYARRYRRYREWCQTMGYQDGPEFITTAKLTEFTVYCAQVHRYAVKTIWQSVRALEVYAERAGVAISTQDARGVLDLYRDELAAVGIGDPRRRGRRQRRTA